MENVSERIGTWGIRCRTCDENIILGTKFDPRYADVFSFLASGSFRCTQGHTHNYDSDDLFFFPSSSGAPVDEAEILKNRANYRLLACKELIAPMGLPPTGK